MGHLYFHWVFQLYSIYIYIYIYLSRFAVELTSENLECQEPLRRENIHIVVDSKNRTYQQERQIIISKWRHIK